MTGIQTYAAFGHPEVLTVPSTWRGRITNTSDVELTLVVGWMPGAQQAVVRIPPGEWAEVR